MFKNWSTLKLYRFALAAWIILLVLLAPTKQIFFGENPATEFILLYVGTLFTFLGSFGFVFIKREEGPTMGHSRTVHGWPAILSGIGWIVVFSGLAS